MPQELSQDAEEQLLRASYCSETRGCLGFAACPHSLTHGRLRRALCPSGTSPPCTGAPPAPALTPLSAWQQQHSPAPARRQQAGAPAGLCPLPRQPPSPPSCLERQPGDQAITICFSISHVECLFFFFSSWYCRFN